MLTHSLFSLRCVCGAQPRREGKTGTCPTCKREFRMEWPAEYEADEDKEPGAGTKTAAA